MSQEGTILYAFNKFILEWNKMRDIQLNPLKYDTRLA